MADVNRTEPPTARRLQRARAEGDHPVSSALVGLAALIAAALVLPLTIQGLLRDARELMTLALQHSEQASPLTFARILLWRIAPLALLSMCGALGLGFWQTGGAFTLKPLAWDFRRASPFTALQRTSSGTRVFEALRLPIAAVLLGFISLKLLAASGAALAAPIGDVRAAASLAARLCQSLLTWGLAVMLLAAAVDALVTRSAWYRRHYMTRDEVKREQRESEGDPGLKQARQRAHRDLVDQADVGQLGAATLLVIGARRLATALRYDPNVDAAPRVLIQAHGALAASLEALAPNEGVLVWTDPALARALSTLAVDEEIPSRHYAAVAEALSQARRRA